jgi:hypothetical protein
VVDRGDHREALLGDVEHPESEGLVVVDDVEVATAILHQPRDALRERLGFGEPGRPHGEDLLDVDQVAVLLGPRSAERVGLPVEVQGRDLRQRDALVELGVRLAGEHLDRVAERRQLTTEVTDVDALATAVWLAAVGHECDAHVPPSP